MATKKKMSDQVGIEAPWWRIYKEISNLFAPDKEIEISKMDESDPSVCKFTISSKNAAKIAALEKIVKNHFVIGNVTLDISFEYIKDGGNITADDFEAAFEGNSNYVTSKVISKGPFQDITYVIFAKEIIQFFDDDLTDIYGNFNGTVEEVASDICNKSSNINFSTANGTEN